MSSFLFLFGLLVSEVDVGGGDGEDRAPTREFVTLSHDLQWTAFQHRGENFIRLKRRLGDLEEPKPNMPTLWIDGLLFL